MSMLQTVTVVWSLLMGLPPWHGDGETKAAREVRMGILAAAIVVASNGERERAISLIVQGASESHFAAHIHRGECEGHPKSFAGECDAVWTTKHGRRVRVHRARGVFQSHSAPRQDLAALWERSLGAGLGPTANSAVLADYYLRARRCGGNLAEMYSAQGNGLCVERPSGVKRAALHRRLRAQWAKEEAH